MADAMELESIVIVPYEDAHAGDFERLNRAWLEQHELLEEGDLKHLQQPRKSILSKGGAIFIALAGDVVVGTCGVVPMGNGVVELVKLAVDEEPSAAVRSAMMRRFSGDERSDGRSSEVTISGS